MTTTTAQTLRVHGIPKAQGAFAKRFWAKVDTSGNCWEWTAATTSHGYGVISKPGGRGAGNAMAHRVAYELLVGPIPEGQPLDHLCRNRGCVNPDHLEPVTHRENIVRGEGACAHHARKTHCPKGHPYSDENTRIDTQGRRRCQTCRPGPTRREAP